MKKNTRDKLAKMNIDRTGLLQLAVFLGKLEVCRYFVEDLRFDVDCSDLCAEVSGSPLVSALQSTILVNESDSLECVKLLIKAGADVNSACPDTPLEAATVNGLTDCIKCLLEAGADPNIGKNQAEKNGKTAKLKLKLDGDKAVSRKNYLAASKLYTQAIELDPDDATLYSNRSLCHLRMDEANKALLDANSCIKIRPEWLKGYYRKGVALMSLKEYKEACDVFLAGLKLDPTNVDMERMFREAIEAMKKDHVTT